MLKRTPCFLLTLIFLLVLLPDAALSEEALADGKVLGESSTQHYLRASYVFGRVLQTADFLKGDNQAGEPIDWYNGIRLEYGWQTDGSKLWHHLYNFPSFGVGVMVADFLNDEELGQPTSLYGYFNWPWRRSGKWEFYSGIGFGISTNWKNYDPATNPYNTAIGSFRNAYIDVGFINASYALSPRWKFVLGLDGTHWSNGGTRKPNAGINVIGTQLLLRYGLQPEPSFPEHIVIPKYQDDNELILTFMGGSRNVVVNIPNDEIWNEYVGDNFAVLDLSVGYHRQTGWRSKWGGGVELLYDESMTAAIDAEDGSVSDVSSSFGDKLGLGFFGGYEQVLHRAGLVVQLGYTVLRKDIEDNPDVSQGARFYQRLGLKYHIWTNTFVGLNVHFHDFSRADYLEFNVGHRWKL